MNCKIPLKGPGVGKHPVLVISLGGGGGPCSNQKNKNFSVQYVKCRYVFDIDPWVYGIDFPILHVPHI